MSVSHSFCPGDYGFSPLVSILSVSLCFWCCSFLFSLVQQLWRRVRVEGISCTQGCATVRLECSWGCGGTGLGFPMPIVNCWLYWKLWGDFHCPLDPCTGPWPRGCVFSPAGTLNWLCVCVLCVLLANLRRGFCYSVISHSATSLNIAGRQASHLSLKDNKLEPFPFTL